ncbi:hypothetical protein K8I61_03105 [bacterium]|nr:hypothetical protein [bacterium]
MSVFDKLRHAFAIDPKADATFSDEERALCRRVADKVVARGMGVPALLFLESARPLNFLGSQALAFFEPIVKGFFDFESYTRFRVILERRGSVELLLEALEAAEAAQAGRIASAKAGRKSTTPANMEETAPGSAEPPFGPEKKDENAEGQ